MPPFPTSCPAKAIIVVTVQTSQVNACGLIRPRNIPTT